MTTQKIQLTKRPGAALSASTADKHALYEASVQDTESDILFINRIYKKTRQTLPLVLREDFSGTAKLCADWVASSPERHAMAVDLHAPTQEWGKRRHMAPLGEVAQRVTHYCQNVLDETPPSDVTVAFNFSWCVFKQRADLLTYFRRVLHDLRDTGVFMLDIHGGTESFEELDETTRHRGFTYVWDQKPYDAINGHAIRHIHFRFPDGTEMTKAFTYDWRIWTLPEVQDALKEVGFKRVEVYWEGDDGNGRGNGVFRHAKRADNETAWIAYVVAWKQ